MSIIRIIKLILFIFLSLNYYNIINNEKTYSYKNVEIKEYYPATWDNNKEEIYDKALERFKYNTDNFNLKDACKEHKNDEKESAACGGDLNTPLETTINGENAHILVVPSVDGKNGKLIVSFDYIFYY